MVEPMYKISNAYDIVNGVMSTNDIKVGSRQPKVLKERKYPKYDKVGPSMTILKEASQWIKPLVWGAFLYGGISLAADGMGIYRDCWLEHRIPSNDCEQAVRASTINAMITTLSFIYLATNRGMHAKHRLVECTRDLQRS